MVVELVVAACVVGIIGSIELVDGIFASICFAVILLKTDSFLELSPLEKSPAASLLHLSTASFDAEILLTPVFLSSPGAVANDASYLSRFLLALSCFLCCCFVNG